MPGLAQDSVVRLRIGLLGAIALSALACCIEAACGGGVSSSYGSDGEGSGNGGSAIFPFSGPTCPDGPPGTENDVTCGECTNGACASELACARTDCDAFFTCACACGHNDFGCQNACPLTAACQACINLDRACSVQAATSTCSAQCPGG